MSACPLVFHSESPCSVEGALENSSFRRLNLAKYHVYLNPFASMCTDCSPVAVMSPHEGELSSECFRGCDRYFRRRHRHRSFVRRRLVGVVIHPKMHLHLGAESVVVALFEKAKAVEVLVAAADQPCEAVWTLKLVEVGGSVKAEPAVQAWWCIISWELLCCFNASVVLNQHHRWGFVVEDRQPCSMSQYPSATIDILCFRSALCLRLRSIFWWCVGWVIWESMHGMLLDIVIKTRSNWFFWKLNLFARLRRASVEFCMRYYQKPNQLADGESWLYLHNLDSHLNSKEIT